MRVVNFCYGGALIGITMTFYETLAIVMKDKGITAADICAKTGIHASYFSKLKSGHTKDVTWEKALVIIAALDMTPNEFYELSKVDKS